MDPDATIVIPAHNASATLAGCLESVFQSEGARFEVIVVDDASVDDTVAVARRYPCRVVRVGSNVMAANCRNIGATHARGEILVFIDADEIVQTGTVRRFVAALRDSPGIDAVVGSLTADTPAPGFFSRFKNFQHHFVHQMAAGEGATLDSGRMAIRRRVFADLGGFEPAFGAASIEDIALGYRMVQRGLRIRFEPAIQLVHLKTYTFAQLVRSDIFNRAIPWTGLMLRERVFRFQMNTRAGNVGSVVLAWLLPLGALAIMLGWPVAWPMTAAILLLVWSFNAAFLLAASRRFGLGFAARAAAFLPLMYWYQGLGLLTGVAAYALGRSVARQRVHPDVAVTVLEPEAQ